MAIPNAIFQFGVPGAYVVEDTAGYIPASLARHNSCYMLGFADKAGAPKNVPYYVTSPEDFTNVFGNSQSFSSVKLFFAQRSGVGLFFVNVPTLKSKTVAVTGTTGTYTITVDGYDIAYTAIAGDTTATILTKLTAEVNKKAAGSARMSGGKIRYSTAVITASVNVTLGTEQTAGAYPTLDEVSDCIATAFTAELEQGYLIAPEFFQEWSSQANRVALAQAMEAHCADIEYYWAALADCGETVAKATSAGTTVLAARAERNLLSSPKGHLAYYVPYLVDTADNEVPCSAAVAGLAIRRNRQQGFQHPPAGTRFPIYGVKGVTQSISKILQEQLNPQGINCIRHLPKDGIVAWGARTVSSSPFYKFVSTRVILNILAGTLKGAFNSEIFTGVDGLGALQGRIKGTAVEICERLRKAGALYGATPEDAYLVICDETNNPGIQLEEGIVAMDVYVKPAPVMEVLGIRMLRTAIGQSFTELVEAQTQAAEEATEVTNV